MLSPGMHLGRRALFILIAIGLALEPLGHELAYILRLGLPQAMLAQSQGAHAYFSPVAESSAALLMIGLVTSVLALVAVRLALGESMRLPRGPFMSPFLILLSVQVVAFIGQETLEAAAGRLTPDFALIGLLAIVGQTPLAALAAFFWSRVCGYIALAPHAVRLILTLRLARPLAVRLLHSTDAPRLAPVTAGLTSHPHRGPPLSSR
jgi:hypothetical protein